MHVANSQFVFLSFRKYCCSMRSQLQISAIIVYGLPHVLQSIASVKADELQTLLHGIAQSFSLCDANTSVLRLFPDLHDIYPLLEDATMLEMCGNLHREYYYAYTAQFRGSFLMGNTAFIGWNGLLLNHTDKLVALQRKMIENNSLRLCVERLLALLCHTPHSATISMHASFLLHRLLSRKGVVEALCSSTIDAKQALPSMLFHCKANTTHRSFVRTLFSRLLDALFRSEWCFGPFNAFYCTNSGLLVAHLTGVRGVHVYADEFMVSLSQMAIDHLFAPQPTTNKNQSM
jgi:hypothetical protein